MKAVTVDKNNLSYFPYSSGKREKPPKTSKSWRYLLRKSPTDVEAFISAACLHCSLRSHCAPAPTEPGAFAGGLLGAVKRHGPLEWECWMKWWEMMGCSGSERFLKPCEMGLADKMSCFSNISDCSSSCDKWSVRITGDTNASAYDTCKCRQRNTDIFIFLLVKGRYLLQNMTLIFNPNLPKRSTLHSCTLE